MAERTLTLHELNRSTLARQMLLERTSLPTLAAMRQLIALQAQLPNSPYIGLWTRLRSYERSELVRMVEDRQAVRATMMRATLQLMAAEDYALLRSALQPALTRSLSAFFGKQVQQLPIDRFVDAARVYIQEQPRTFVEIRAKLAELFPDVDPALLAYAVRMHLPLVQVPPGGLWDFTGSPAMTLALTWLERPLADAEEGLHSLILRYLATYGPATVKDLQTWSGLTGLKDVVKAYKPALRTFRDEQGNELLDLIDAPLPEASLPVPPRFLPEFDNLLLAHADRRRIIADEYRSSVFLTVGRVRATFLIDGFVNGTWKTEQTRKTARLLLEPFQPLATTIRAALIEEGERLLRWFYYEAETFEIQVVEA
ncbi:MAG TPA: winged helix DNA-binding domain-containing protein [Ktedonobacteraceae bacterium]|nr:winged helix DNA-binding domain-containing protein [Ktedonobacteraceae bacterium]